jgi:Protein of unknown function (DUF3455)
VTARRRTVIGSLGLSIGAGLIAIAAVATGGSASAALIPQYGMPNVVKQANETELVVPPALVPPAGQEMIAAFGATGVQVYGCTAGTWVFVEPAANLLGWASGSSALQTAIHFRGPSWESTTDGSLVQARSIASSPVSGSIPELLLQATTNRGDGLFGRVAYIQRLSTSGGVAPTGGCTDGQTAGVQYHALYRFFAPAS